MKRLGKAFLITMTASVPLLVLGFMMAGFLIPKLSTVSMILSVPVVLLGLLSAVTALVLSFIIAFKSLKSELRQARAFLVEMFLAVIWILYWATVGNFADASGFVQFLAVVGIAILVITAIVNAYKLSIKAIKTNPVK
jgi:hypothetical protein